MEADSKQLGRKRRASSVSLFEPLCESEMIISMVGGVYFDSLIGTAAHKFSSGAGAHAKRCVSLDAERAST